MTKSILLLLGVLLPLKMLLGQNAKLPKLLEYSKNEITAREGSVISLNLKAEGSELSYRWIKRGGRQICAEESCRLNTSGWGAGEHKIFAIAFNGSGDAMVVYHIKLLPRSSELRQDMIEPERERLANKVRYFPYEKQSVRTLRGEAFMFGAAEVNVIDSRKQLLTWNKRMVLPLVSLALFGKEKAQEFLSTGGSQLTLINSGRVKTIILERGVLRARFMEASSLNTIIKIGKQIQIQGSTPSDFLISIENGKDSNKKHVNLTVLRGKVSFSYFEQASTEADAEPAVFRQLVQEGASLQGFRNERNSFKTMAVAPSSFEKNFYTTTPYYRVNFEEPFDGNAHKFGRTMKEKPKGFKEAIEKAKNLVKERIYLSALEQLLPFNGQIYDDYSLAYLLGKTSKELFLYEQARLALEIAVEIDDDREEARLELAHLSLLEESWQEAEDLFDDTSSKSSENSKLWNYYRGVLNYKLGSFRNSSWFLTRSLWAKSNQEVDKSIGSFLSQIHEEKKFFGAIEVSYMRDSNPMKVAQKMKNNAGVGIAWSDGVQGHLGFGYHFFKEGFNRSLISWDTKLQGYPDISIGNYVDQTLSIPTYFSIIGGAEQEKMPQLYFGLGPLLGAQMVGTQMAYDKVGMNWSIGSFSLGLQLEASYSDHMHIDPDPNTLKPLDPINWEDNDKLDIGFRTKGFHLLGKKVIGNLNVNFRLTMSEFLYRYIETLSKSFSSIQMLVDLRYIFSLRWEAAASFNYENRDFTKSETKRADTILGYGIKLFWAWLPPAKLVLGIDSDSRSSNLSQFSYQRWIYRSGLFYNF